MGEASVQATAVNVEGACPWCGGKVLRNYKSKPGYQKCYSLACHRVSWEGIPLCTHTQSKKEVQGHPCKKIDV